MRLHQESIKLARPATAQLRNHRIGAIHFGPLLRCTQCGDPIVQIGPGKWRCQYAIAGRCQTRKFQLRNIDILSARQLVQWVRAIDDWDIFCRECRYHLAEHVLTLLAALADTRLEIHLVLNAIETGTHSFRISEGIPKLEQDIERIESQLFSLAVDPQPLPSACQLRSRLEPQAKYIYQKITTPKHRGNAAKRLAALLHRIDMSPGGPGRRPSLKIQPDILAFARSVHDPHTRPPTT